MRLIIAIVQDRDVNQLTAALNDEGFRATKLASTGGFLKSFNTTLFIGCEDDKVDDVLKIIQARTKSLKKHRTAYPMRANTDLFNMKNIEIGGATVFVLPIDSFHQF
mgnify:CR=1 FL=1